MSNEQQQKVPVPENLINPGSQGYINQMISAAVTEAITGVFAQLLPTLKDMALTPEKIHQITHPEPSAKEVAKAMRELRETQKSKEDEAQLRREVKARQDGCPHTYANKTDSISTIHNYPDRQVRGICHLCHKLIEPRHWVIDAPFPMDYPDVALRGKSNAHIVDADKDYPRVLNLELTRA